MVTRDREINDPRRDSRPGGSNLKTVCEERKTVNEKRGNQIEVAYASARRESCPSRLMKQIQTREGRVRKSRTDERITQIPMYSFRSIIRIALIA